MEKTIYSSDYDVFRKMIRRERERRKLSQEELGALLQRHQPFVARVESGQRRLDVIEFIHFMEVLEVSPISFLRRLIKEIEQEQEADGADQ